MTATTQAPKRESIEELEGRAEEIAAEVEALEQQLGDAKGQLARAERRFTQLEARRKELSPKVFAGDEKARVELEGVEDEHDELTRSVRVARSARPELERMLAEAKERLSAANTKVKRAQASEISREIKEIEARRDKVAAGLEEILREHGAASARYERAVREYDGDAANRLAIGLSRGYAPWLKKRFGIS